ncbi:MULTISPECIES: DNA-3-methyladenine glycosylase I [Ferrimonas]|uniref:DNA-3-methyladenine glycosylase I n=1 Tax=Ferrimonas TaxID=44011 RepID=UPI0003F78038|nr:MULTISPECIES: DNA-3-methyladenine glycosylase I [Ferrimonas]USD37608.1 DNA-3-methyladenine glycosylase I [Ferrimonas sp. SCSIO 43195]
MDKQRCSWCGTDPQYVEYHDTQWGRPVRDKRELFAKLCLDGQQAGLSWLIILRKTPHYFEVFEQFDPARIAEFDEARVELLLQDPGIVRNRLKVNSIIKNAKAYLALQQQGVDFSDYLWSFVGGQPIDNALKPGDAYPTRSVESDAMSKALKKAGFSFVGTTICYAFMQAVGMFNDHLVNCPSYRECQQLSQ